MKEYLSLFLPEALLDHFDLGLIQELGEISHKRMIYQIHLTEKNELPKGYSKKDYESKGFYRAKTIQDFPIRGKAVYLIIKRRRWRHKITKQELKSDYSFIAEGSKLTNELSDFLKDTGRDPRRHH
ncbi:ISAon1 family transposase N-terminal region protein [Psychroflexus sp. MBR-150]